MVKISYADENYESPPNVVRVAANEKHTLSTEEFDEVPTFPEKKSTMSIKEIMLASHEKDDDGTDKVSAKSIFRMAIYACFLILVTYIALARASVQTYYFTKIVGDLFVTSKTLPTRKSFVEIRDMNDIWDFLEVEFLQSLYKTNLPTSADSSFMVYYNNKLLGRPRIRMLKVTNNSCKVVHSFAREITQCFANYHPSVEDKESFGPADSEAYIWQSEDVLFTETAYGVIANYGGGGFILRLPLEDIAEASELLAAVKSNRWISRATRAIIIDFTMFNANVNLFSIARLLLELPASGGVIPTYRFSTYDLMRYLGSFGNVLIVLEGILFGFIIYYIIEEVLDLIRFRLAYLFSFWNIVDITLLSLCSAEVYLNYNRIVVAYQQVNSALDNDLTDASFDEVFVTQEKFNNVAAVILFLAWIKRSCLDEIVFHVFNYIGFNKTMNQLSATLSRSTKDIGGFAVMFAVFFFAYAQFGYLVFGTQIADYSTFYSSVFALLRTILGDFNFSALERTNGILGPIFFITYIFFVFFVLLNMFLAIINDSYVEVKAELARQQEGNGILDWLKKKLKGDHLDDKKLATYNDYKNSLMIAGYAEKDIDGVFDKLDINHNGKIHDDVLNEISSEIKKQATQRKVFDEEYRSNAVLARRVDMMDRAIIEVTDKISKVLEQLHHIEQSSVAVKERQNDFRTEGFKKPNLH